MSHKYNPPHNEELEWASVTTIISSCIDKSQGLMPWCASEVCNWIR